jgi:undecaprenyl-diphosphatase
MDIGLLFFFNRGMANPFFDVLMPALTFQGYLLAGPFILYALYRGATGRDDAGKRYLSAAITAVVISLVSVILADLACGWLKDVAARPRPCQVLEGVRLIVSCPRTLSLPSNHAATSFAFITPYFVFTRSFIQAGWRAYLLMLASLVSLSRPYLGVHYPLDIAAGALLGVTITGVLCWMFWKISQRSDGGNNNKSKATTGPDVVGTHR